MSLGDFSSPVYHAYVLNVFKRRIFIIERNHTSQKPLSYKMTTASSFKRQTLFLDQWVVGVNIFLSESKVKGWGTKKKFGIY